MFKVNILKSFIQKIKIIKSQKKLLNSLNLGDLVWAKMPLPKKELNKVEESHQIRPYLVMHKDKFNIVNIAYKSEIEEILKKKRDIEYKQKELSNSEKKKIEETQEIFYENGTVFGVGRNKIVYLFKYKDIHYGIDLLMYKIKPKVIPIFDIEKRQILEILPSKEYIKIIEFLSSKNVQPLKEINRLYDELRQIVYK